MSLYRLLFLFSLAVKDAWYNRLSLWILSSCCIIGTASLLSISSLQEDLSREVQNNTKSLLGADLLISSRQASNPEYEKFISGINEYIGDEFEQSKETTFASMVLFEKSNKSRLIQLSGISDSYPLYGSLKTEPVSASIDLHSKGGALLDFNLKAQYGVVVGDWITLGSSHFQVRGFIIQSPGSINARSILAPKIVISITDINKTDLIRTGSLVRYNTYFKFQSSDSNETLRNKLTPSITALNLSMESSDERGENLQKTLSSLYQFFDAVTLLSFLLGALGIGTGAYMYKRQKDAFISTLHCLGLKRIEGFYFYLSQILIFGISSILVGILLGIGIYLFLPRLFAELLPFSLSPSIYYSSIFKSSGTALILLLIVSIFSYYGASYRLVKTSKYTHFKNYFLLSFVPVLFLVLWARLLLQNFKSAILYSIGIVLLFAVLVLFAYSLRFLARFFSERTTSFAIQQGVRNLYRPNNRTSALLTAIGISTFSVFLIYTVNELSIAKIKLLDTADQANLLLFDIQEEQVDPLIDLLKVHNLPVQDIVPIVTMRLISINDRTIQDIRNDIEYSKDIPKWTLTREYRSSYRSSLSKTEELIKGELVSLDGNRTEDVNDIIPVSIEKGIAEKLKVKIAGNLTFDVQGLHIKTQIRSIRKVDWQHLTPNFFFIFPNGVLEDAPKNYVLMSRYLTEKQNTLFQSELISTFGNISAIDLSLILSTIKDLSDQIIVVVVFLSLIILITSLVLLSGIIWGSRAIRLEENAILRTLGAKSSLLQKIMCAEYFCLAIIGSISGLLAATFATFLLAVFILKTPPQAPNIFSLLILILFVIVIALIGLLGSVGLIRKPSMESLRAIESN